MFSYKEFPEQVTSEMDEFSTEHQFELFLISEDHNVVYRNNTWEIDFYCDHGAVLLSLVNLEDGYSYSMHSVLQEFFPTSKYAQESSNYVWGSLKTVQFRVDSLKEHFSSISLMYHDEKDRLLNHRSRSGVLISFIHNNASSELRNAFEWSNNRWLEKASAEYSNYLKRPLLTKFRNTLKDFFTIFSKLLAFLKTNR